MRSSLSEIIARTRRQTLLQLIRLFRILQHQRVHEPRASDFEFDLVGVSLYVAS